MKRSTPWILYISILLMAGFACQLSPKTISGSPAPTPVIVITPPSTTPIPAQAPDLEYQDTLLTTLYARVDPGIVSIQVLSQGGGSLGSGFVFDQQGHIVTNFHVIDGAQDLEVDFPSGLKVRGTVVGKDTDSDIAVVAVKAPQTALFPLEMGDSDQIKVGQSVVAIGNPFGLTGTMTTGIVSARGRTLSSIRQASDGTPFSAGGLIQTDAAINPGNSGGPLLDLKGRVIGINRAIRTTTTNQSGDATSSGVGFAVPVNIIKRVVPVLIAKGNYDYPYLGVGAHEELSLLEQEALGLPQTSGAYVVDVTPGGPADKGGLKGGNTQTKFPGLPSGGDLITAVDSRPVLVFGDLLTYLMENKSPGDTIKLTILRNKQQEEVTIILGKRP